MLFMLIVKESQNAEAGQLPPNHLMEAMDRFNEALIEANVRVMAKGLHPSSNALRITYPIPDGDPVITQGPFEDPQHIIAGFILIDVTDKEEAIRWALKMPDPQGFGEGQIELRQVFE